ncbi:MAG: amidohydrolase family protein [Solirubrobacterales bacterium]|nr:amidohydrolase family protein [Solirubrobacterales bacterium]
MFDLGLENGVLVGPTGRAYGHLYVSGGRIAAIAAQPLPAAETVDARDLLVMPGMVDAHVHFMDPGDPSREDFPTASAAAARAGVTTVIEHTHARPVRTAAELEAKRTHLNDRSVIDFGLAAHAWPDRLDAVDGVVGAGAAFIKAFTCTTHGVPGLRAADLHALLTRLADLPVPCLVHAEDESLTEEAERALRAAGRDDPGIVPRWRSRAAEEIAIAVVGQLARRLPARVVIAHVSGAGALAEVARAREAGAPLLAETCPQYLTLLEAEVLEHAAFRKFTPPARAGGRADLDRMWHAVAVGDIDYIATDHAPATPAQKRAGSIWDVHFGLPGIDTTLSVLLDGAQAGRLTYERVVELYSQRPAQVYGLYPRKGSLEVGAEADLVLVDPKQEWRVRDEDIISRAGWSPLAGRTLVGRAVRTYVRGRLVADGDEVKAPPGTGRFVAGAGA